MSSNVESHLTSPEHLLSNDQVSFYEENGYLIGDILFDEEQLVELREHMARVFAGWYETGVAPNKIDWHPGDPETDLKKLDGGWWADKVIERAVTHRSIGAMAAQLAKTNVIRLFQGTAIHKPGIGHDAPRSAVIGWHQDCPYWRCATPADLLTARIALDAETIENGCMRVLKGSHRWPEQSAKMFYSTESDISDLPKLDLPAGATTEVVPCLLKPGQVMFHHCMTMHGSSENRTYGPRRSFSIHLAPGHIRYQSGHDDDHPWNVALLHGSHGGQAQDGDLWEGEKFPVIYSV